MKFTIYIFEVCDIMVLEMDGPLVQQVRTARS